jgi:hypothetical protein
VLQDQRLDFTELTVGGWHSGDRKPSSTRPTTTTVALYARSNNAFFDEGRGRRKCALLCAFAALSIGEVRVSHSMS